MQVKINRRGMVASTQTDVDHRRLRWTGFAIATLTLFAFVPGTERQTWSQDSAERQALTKDAPTQDQGLPVKIRVDASSNLGELKPIWRYFGADEPNYAYMKDGKKLLEELGELAPQQVFFRAHNLLCTGDGTPALKWGSTNAYTEDANGEPVYDWTIVDRIFDAYLESDVRPFAQIGFMPKALSIEPEPYQHDWEPGDPYDEVYTGWAHPPEDYEQWQELVYEWVKHCVERYGQEEVESWYWEVWNEPDIGYWQGRPRQETFFRLHDHAIAGVKRALPTAKVGGPDLAYDGRFLRAFLEHCSVGTNYATGEKGTPLDFITFHAKGNPQIIGRTEDSPGHVRMGMGQQLRVINNTMSIIASFPEYKDTPIVIGESDPDGCAACRAIEYPQYGYRNTSQFAAYTAASFARKYELSDRNGVNLEGALSWTFTFEDQPLFAGMRALATGGIDKPVLNTFRMFAKMKGHRISVESSHGYTLDQIMARRPSREESSARLPDVTGQPDVNALASSDGNTIGALVWHYHADGIAGETANVELTFAGLPDDIDDVQVTHFRIDETNSNAHTRWLQMGSPQELTPEQLAELQEAGQLARIDSPKLVEIQEGEATFGFELPRQGISLVLLHVESK